MNHLTAPDRARGRSRRRDSSGPAAVAGSQGAGSWGAAVAGSRPRSPARGRQPAAAERWIYGRHPVAAALANPERRWRCLVVLAGQEAEAHALVAGARAIRQGSGEPVRVRDRSGFAAILPESAVHQGLALEIEPLAERDLDDLLRVSASATGRHVIVVLDQVSDPQNVGAALRSSAAFGALAVIVARHGAPPSNGALAKAASGALETIPLIRVVNLARALDHLKKEGFWVCGLDEGATQTLSALDLGERIAIVLGSEGDGMRRLVRERCDQVARLPTLPAQPTLNVSNAAAVALYELARGGAGAQPR